MSKVTYATMVMQAQGGGKLKLSWSFWFKVKKVDDAKFLKKEDYTQDENWRYEDLKGSSSSIEIC